MPDSEEEQPKDPAWRIRMMLAAALFNLRESGGISTACDTVRLPDGSLFEVDSEFPHSDRPHIDDWNDWLKSIQPW